MENLITDLGIISSWAETGNQLRIYNSTITLGHKINIETVDFSKEWFVEEYTFTQGRVYRYFIERLNHSTENLFLYCKLLNPVIGISFGGDSGQWMDAIIMENADSHLHIGTEDAESMLERLASKDWVPERLQTALENMCGFSQEIDFGLMIKVPELHLGERIYFHFVVAADKTRPDKNYPEDDDISTWRLVNIRKGFLDRDSSLTRQLTEALKKSG